MKVKFTNHKTGGRKLEFRAKHGFSLSSTFGKSIHIILICFYRNLDHPHINVVTFVPRKQSKKPQFFHKMLFFVEEVFDIYLLLGLSSLFTQNSCTFLTKNILFDYSGVRFVPPFLKKSQTFKVAKKPGN